LSVAVICGVLLASTGQAQNATNAAAWPPVVRAPAGAPNVVLVLLDDTGYGYSSVFGGPVPTPNIDKVASQGLRYNNFHVNAMCSPTRAALLSGRNSHEIGFGRITESATPEAGYNSLWPKSAVPLAEVLKRNGYSTAAFGKWHNTPTWEVNPAGPFTHWPTSLGFEHFYGFLGAATSQFDPVLYRNTAPADLPQTPEQGYILNHDLVNEAKQWVHQHDAGARNRPFFLYFATGAIHTPHQVPKDWIAKFKGQFDKGWDKQREETFAKQKALGIIPASAEFTPRHPELRAWDSYSADQQKIFAAQAEVYAAYLAETDYELGRLFDDIKAAGHTNDTAFFIIVGDNGASAEGGLEPVVGNRGATVEEQLARIGELGSRDLTTHVQSGWAWAANTPFSWAKRTASHLGGTTDPLIVSWPGHIQGDGSVRSQFSFVTDIAPTIFELAHIQFPKEVDGVKQLPLEGSSLVFTFDDAQAPTKHTRQYFEMVGNRGIYKDGWWAGSRLGVPWGGGPLATGSLAEPGKWELYDLTRDFNQSHDLADQNPARLKELVDFYAAEAKRNHVYPVGDRGPGFGGAFGGSANGSRHQTSWTFRGGAERISGQFGPRIGGHSHRITAEVEVGDETPNGVIFANGGRTGGVVLFAKNGRLIYEGAPRSSSPAKASHTQIIATEQLPKGKSVIEVVATRAESASGDQDATTAQAAPNSPGLVGVGGGDANLTFNISLVLNGKSVATGQFKGISFGGGNGFGGGAPAQGGIRQGTNSLGRSLRGANAPNGGVGGGLGGAGFLSIGSNKGTPVSKDYVVPNSFNGEIGAVTFAITSSEDDVETN
jgi:arylsulfatase